MDPNKDWVLLKASNLNPSDVIADPDFGETPEESISNGGTFAYNKNVPPSNVKVVSLAKGTDEERHDEFSSLKENPAEQTLRTCIQLMLTS